MDGRETSTLLLRALCRMSISLFSPDPPMGTELILYLHDLPHLQAVGEGMYGRVTEEKRRSLRAPHE